MRSHRALYDQKLRLASGPTTVLNTDSIAEDYDNIMHATVPVFPRGPLQLTIPLLYNLHKLEDLWGHALGAAALLGLYERICEQRLARFDWRGFMHEATCLPEIVQLRETFRTKPNEIGASFFDDLVHAIFSLKSSATNSPRRA
jgi:hypothetical protein